MICKERGGGLERRSSFVTDKVAYFTVHASFSFLFFRNVLLLFRATWFIAEAALHFPWCFVFLLQEVSSQTGFFIYDTFFSTIVRPKESGK